QVEQQLALDEALLEPLERLVDVIERQDLVDVDPELAAGECADRRDQTGAPLLEGQGTAAVAVDRRTLAVQGLEIESHLRTGRRPVADDPAPRRDGLDDRRDE